jgi:hypothetical protein
LIACRQADLAGAREELAAARRRIRDERPDPHLTGLPRAEIRLNLSLPGLTRQPIIFLKSLLQD